MPSELLFLVGVLGVVGIAWTLRRRARRPGVDPAPPDGVTDARVAAGLVHEQGGARASTCWVRARVAGAGPPPPVPTRRALTCVGFGGSDDVSIDGPDELVSCPVCAGTDPEVVFFGGDLAVLGCSHCVTGES